jgi:hypothetical protein
MTPLDHVVAIGRVLDGLAVPWVLGGSLASSLIGEPRSTMDIDVAVRLEPDRVDPLVTAVERDYYVSLEMVRSAVLSNRPFNLIHLATAMKVDVFPLSDDPLDVRQLARRRRVEIPPDVVLWVGSPEDQILRKLRWFREGGEVSDRQWNDVVSIVRVQGDRLDRRLLTDEADELGLGDLWLRIIDAAPPGTS